MSKNVFCLALCAMLFALCSSGEVQQAKKVLGIGIYRRSIPLLTPPVAREFGGLCAISATYAVAQRSAGKSG
jgi:hypothetical protein